MSSQVIHRFLQARENLKAELHRLQVEQYHSLSNSLRISDGAEVPLTESENRSPPSYWPSMAIFVILPNPMLMAMFC